MNILDPSDLQKTGTLAGERAWSGKSKLIPQNVSSLLLPLQTLSVPLGVLPFNKNCYSCLLPA